MNKNLKLFLNTNSLWLLSKRRFRTSFEYCKEFDYYSYDDTFEKKLKKERERESYGVGVTPDETISPWSRMNEEDEEP